MVCNSTSLSKASPDVPVFDLHTLEPPLEHVARTRPVTERVRHLEVVVVCSGGIDSCAVSVVSENAKEEA